MKKFEQEIKEEDKRLIGKMEKSKEKLKERINFTD